MAWRWSWRARRGVVGWCSAERDDLLLIVRSMMALAEGISSERRSLDEVHGSVAVPTTHGTGQRLRRLFAFLGSGLPGQCGLHGPGNWATDLEGGARFGYALIWVLLMSNIMAVLLQTLAARLGVVTGHDLAQACRAEYSRALNAVLWVLAEVAIAATDLAEILGTIIALKLLFGLPLLWGCLITAFDTFLLLYLQRWGMRQMEAVILALWQPSAPVFWFRFSWPSRIWGRLSGFAAELTARGVVCRHRHPGRHGDAAQPVFALGAGPDPRDRRRCAQQADGLPLLHDRRRDCLECGIFCQRRDSDFERRGVPPPWDGGHDHRRGAQTASFVPWSGRSNLVRRRFVMRRPKLDTDRDARRADRDGGLSPPPAGAVAPPPDYSADCIGPGRGSYFVGRGSGDAATADLEPGGFEPSAFVRGDSADSLHVEPQKHGPIRDTLVGPEFWHGRRPR